jgi:hypothetical protein
MSQWRSSDTFPSPTTHKSAVCIVNSANLPSATLDGKNLGTTLATLGFNEIIIIVDSDNAKKRLISSNNVVVVAQNKNELISYLLEHIKTLNAMNRPVDFVFTLSSHGYACGNHNYINFDGSIINDSEFHNIFNSLSKNIRCLALIDTCQSGTMLNLRYCTSNCLNIIDENVENNSDVNLVCISAVSDCQSDSDDISELGYGGGLTCGFIDYVFEKNHLTVGDFYKAQCQRVISSGVNPLLSFNNVNFLN